MIGDTTAPTPKTPLQSMQEVVAIQGNQGNWNYDPYMQGMFNGMELMLSIMEDREPVFRKAPEQWIRDYPSDKFTDAFTKLAKATDTGRK